MDPKTHQRVEQWLRDVETELSAPLAAMHQREISFKNSELARKRMPPDGSLWDEEETTAPPPLSSGTLLAYAGPSFALTSMTLLIGIHGAVFYIKIGAHLAFYAFFIAVARCFDVVSDPVMGWATDVTDASPESRATSKYAFVRALARVPLTGRRRPYMAVFALGYACCLFLLLSPPSSLNNDWAISLWFGVFYCGLYAMDTAANVPYNSLGPELTAEAGERERLFYRIGAVKNVGILLAVTLPVLLGVAWSAGDSEPAQVGLGANGTTDLCPRPSNVPYSYEECWGTSDLCGCLEGTENGSLSSERYAMTVVAAIFAVEYVISMAYCLAKVRERTPDPKETTAVPPVVPSLLTTLRNKPFMHLLPAWVLDMTAVTLIGTMLPFFVEYVVKPWAVPECDRMCCGHHSDSVLYSGCRSHVMCKTETWLGVALVALFTASVLAMPLWLSVTRCYGKRKAWLLFNLLTALTNGIFVFVGAGDPIFMCVLAAVNGIPVGAQFLTDSIVADVIDYDELLTGRRSEGKYMIFQTFIPKLVSIPAQTVPIGLLSVVGFVTPCGDGAFHPQPARVRWYMEVLFYGLPTICALASYFIKRRFPLKEEMMTQVREGCALHMAGKPARDPLTGRIHRLPSFARDPVLLRNAVWKLDHFFVEQVELLREDAKEPTPHGCTEGRRALVAQLRPLYRRWVAAAVLFFAVVGLSLGLGLINTPATALLPTLGVIASGISVAGACFTRQQLKTARELLDRPLVWSQCRLVLEEFLDWRNGVEAWRAYDEGWFAPLMQKKALDRSESLVATAPELEGGSFPGRGPHGGPPTLHLPPVGNSRCDPLFFDGSVEWGLDAPDAATPPEVSGRTFPSLPHHPRRERRASYLAPPVSPGTATPETPVSRSHPVPRTLHPLREERSLSTPRAPRPRSSRLVDPLVLPSLNY